MLSLLPGLVLRALVRLYPPDDPRRTELIAELHAVPPHHRPAWAAEQIETALLDGLPSRTRHLRRRRSALTWQRTRLRPRPRTPQVTASATAAAVLVWYWLFMSLVWSGGPLLFYLVILPLAPLLQ